MERAFVDGERRHRLATRDARQPFGFGGVAIAEHDRGRRRARGAKRVRDERAAELFDDHAERQIAEFGAAMRFGHDDAAPAHLAHVAPGVDVEPFRGRGIPQASEGGDRGFVVTPFARHVAQHRLFFGEDGHAVSS